MLWGPAKGPDFGHVSARALAKILAQAPPSLQEVRVPIFRRNPSISPCPLIDVEELPAVERILTQAAFPSLRSLVFELTTEERLEEYLPLLKDALPALSEREVLVVEPLVSTVRLAQSNSQGIPR